MFYLCFASDGRSATKVRIDGNEEVGRQEVGQEGSRQESGEEINQESRQEEVSRSASEQRALASSGGSLWFYLLKTRTLGSQPCPTRIPAHRTVAISGKQPGDLLTHLEAAGPDGRANVGDGRCDPGPTHRCDQIGDHFGMRPPPAGMGDANPTFAADHHPTVGGEK